MQNKISPHTFHIPVMGIGYSIDTPVKVAHYGISSVISLVDDILIERMREFYCRKLNIPFQAISDEIDDFRAKRITEYLNLIHRIINENFDKLKKSLVQTGSELEKYIKLLPEYSDLKLEFQRLSQNKWDLKDIQNWVHDNLRLGSIDVNIMTKLDRENFSKGEKLPGQYNDAHAALRGFAQSNLQSSLVLSAGMNPRLYTYLEEFEDFYPNEKEDLRKKIILKVSDYRSALIQGKVMAKKGIWVSEYRIESGLNCGGHAFPTDGYLLGPILEEFKQNRSSLIEATYSLFADALKRKDRYCPEVPPEVKFTAQGGVGTTQEHEFLLNHYQVDSVGWGTPFLLVPEVTNVDDKTLELLENAGEEDLLLSNTSPLGIPFNTLKGNTKDVEKLDRIKNGRPGSPCTQKYAALSKEFTDEVICVSSRKYQSLKIKELGTRNIPPEQYEKEYEKIVEKSCICVGLGTSAMLVNKLDTKVNGKGVSICPGPNMAYFSQAVSLEGMVDHIYGRADIIKRKDRPNMFAKELKMYLEHLKSVIAQIREPIEERQERFLTSFSKNLSDGIEYYRSLKFQSGFDFSLSELENFEHELKGIGMEVSNVNS